ncbi:MAG: MATE family efflux transporter [Chitinophagia bacterium]|nr:MATE family efflux transporter [Chitinophagia bacterium]
MESVGTIKNLKVKVSYQQILSIAVPITLALLIPQINMLTNSIFLGNLSTESLGNAGITGVYYLIFAVVGHGLNNAMQSVFSRYAGSGDSGAFKIILAQGIRISLQFAAAGILLTWFIAPYILQKSVAPGAFPVEMSFLKIRILGLPFLYLFQMGNAFLVASLNSRYLMIGFISEALLNILLDYLLIFGHAGFPSMGFNGAALASVISEFIGFIVVLLVLYQTGLRKEYSLFKKYSFDKTKTKEIVKVAIPLVVQFVISVGTWLVFFIFIEDKGTEAKAISNTMRNVFGLVGVFVWAFAATSNIMVSNIIGQQRNDLVLVVINRITILSFSFCSMMCLIINIFPQQFFALFGQTDQFITNGISVLRVVSLGLMIMSISNIWLNGITGTGKTMVNLLIEIFAILFYMSYTWVFMKVNYLSLEIAWGNEIVYWIFIFLASFIFFKRGKWRNEIKS